MSPEDLAAFYTHLVARGVLSHHDKIEDILASPYLTDEQKQATINVIAADIYNAITDIGRTYVAKRLQKEDGIDVDVNNPESLHAAALTIVDRKFHSTFHDMAERIERVTYYHHDRYGVHSPSSIARVA